jgi:hypothetical protein
MKKVFLIAFQFIVLTSFSQWQKSDATPNPLAIASRTEFDPAYSSDSEGNTYYCWTDFRNGRGELFAQKLNEFGVPQWAANGIRVGLVMDATIFANALKSIQPLSNGGALVAYHKIVNIYAPAEREIYYNIIGKEGNLVLAESPKIETSSRISNNDINLGSITSSEIAKDKYRLVFNTGNGFGHSNEILSLEIGNNGKVISNPKQVTKTNIEEAKLLFDDLNKRLLVIMNAGSNLAIESWDYDFNLVKSSNITLNNTIGGTLRIDELYIENGQVIIGQTLTNGGLKKVVAQRLDKNLENIWSTGGVVLGSGSGFDMHVTLNDDGGGSVAWIEPNSNTARMMAARFDNNGQVIWQKPVFNGQSNVNYFSPNKFVTDRKNGFYNLWFTPKSSGFDLSIQHIDANGNQVFGAAGLSLTAFNWYGSYRLLPQRDGGVIAFYAGSKNADINSEEYDLYTNYISPSGNFGKEQKLAAALNKIEYCAGETLVANLAEGTYTASLKSDNLVILVKGEKYNEFVLPNMLNEGAYEVVFENQNNLESEGILFSIYTLKKPTLSSSFLEKCADSDTEITLNGVCDKGNINWSTNQKLSEIIVSPTVSTNYSASCIQLGCTNSSESKIDVKVLSISGSASNSGSYFEGETISLKATGGDTYSWTGPNSFTSNQENPIIENSSLTNGGVYSVVVSSVKGCTATYSTTVEVKKVLGVEVVKLGLKVFPNPAQEILRYNSSLKLKAVSAFSANGQEMVLYFNKTERIIKVSELASGVYTLKVQHEDDTLSFARFIKE